MRRLCARCKLHFKASVQRALMMGEGGRPPPHQQDEPHPTFDLFTVAATLASFLGRFHPFSSVTTSKGETRSRQALVTPRQMSIMTPKTTTMQSRSHSRFPRSRSRSILNSDVGQIIIHARVRTRAPTGLRSLNGGAAPIHGARGLGMKANFLGTTFARKLRKGMR